MFPCRERWRGFGFALLSSALAALSACGSDREFGSGNMGGSGGQSGSSGGTGGGSGGSGGAGSGGVAGLGGSAGEAGEAGAAGDGSGGTSVCTPNTTRCVEDTLRTCDDDGSSEVSTACPNMEFCGRAPAACHPYVVAGYATTFTSGYLYTNNDGDAVNELAGISWTLTERIELRRLGLIVLEPTSPEASVVRFLIVADDNPSNPEAGTILHEQNLTVTNAGGSEADIIEVDATSPVLLGPGKIWLLIQAPPPVLLTADWNAQNVEWSYHGMVESMSPPNIYIRGAVR